MGKPAPRSVILSPATIASEFGSPSQFLPVSSLMLPLKTETCCHRAPSGMLWHLPPFCCLCTDSRPTVETLGPTMKSEETTTLYPIDEETTECGENCSFEDGEQHDFASERLWGSAPEKGRGT